MRTSSARSSRGKEKDPGPADTPVSVPHFLAPTGGRGGSSLPTASAAAAATKAAWPA
jgi:hypothetical protein